MYNILMFSTNVKTGFKEEKEFIGISQHDCFTSLKIFLYRQAKDNLHLSFAEISEYLKYKEWKDNLKNFNIQ